MACLALTKKGKHCRNYAQDNSITCNSHTDFFINGTDVRKALFRGINGTLPKAMLLQFDTTSRYWVTKVLSDKLVRIKKKDISRITLDENDHATAFVGRFFGYFILLCARHVEGFSYTWNEWLWKKTVEQLWRWSQAIGPVDIRWKDICQMLCVKEVAAFYKGCAEYPELADAFTEDEWFKFFNYCARKNP
jgi:hypothetical protein